MRRITVAGTLLLVVTALASPATATTSAVQSCTSHSVPSSGYTPTDGYALDDNSPVRKGPHAHCTAVWHLDPGEPMTYWCYVYNEDGNTWTYGYVGSGRYGWVWDGHLADSGSKTPC